MPNREEGADLEVRGEENVFCALIGFAFEGVVSCEGGHERRAKTGEDGVVGFVVVSDRANKTFDEVIPAGGLAFVSTNN